MQHASSSPTSSWTSATVSCDKYHVLQLLSCQEGKTCSLLRLDILCHVSHRLATLCRLYAMGVITTKKSLVQASLLLLHQR